MRQPRVYSYTASVFSSISMSFQASGTICLPGSAQKSE